MVLASWSGAEPRRTKARALLSDPTSAFVGNDMLALELLPDAAYMGNAAEVCFVSAFLARIKRVPIDAAIITGT